MNKCEHVQAASTEGAGSGSCTGGRQVHVWRGGMDPKQTRGLGQSPVQRGDQGQNSVQAS